MVIQSDNNDITCTTYTQHFDKYSFPLSIFQKFAIKAIVDGHHSLSCVPTGSGKTLPALFAIDYFTNMGKKVIYTSPIKALSNQKYYEFSQKFPSTSIGLLTGDIKINPEAQVLIMTAEILQNTLYRRKNANINENNKSLLHFDMDFDKELACVIQDEIHMINDKERGHVWENIILMLPHHIQMVMLSATLDNPIKFASWIETNATNNYNKKVYLATSNYRPVPLTHYAFITTPQSAFKAIKDKVLQNKIRNDIDKLHIIQTPTGKFNEDIYHNIKNTLNLFQKNNVHIKRSFVLNQVCKYMLENNMLPAVCFILSRKQLEIAAHEIGVSLLNTDDDEKVFNRKKECEKILREKIPNFKEYIELPEYHKMIQLLEKGIAIHHSGIMPILREMVELLFEKGYIQLLFATETFSVGLNMPIKSVLFTDVKKFDGSHRRMLHSHEYIQASGRAGRRGLDSVGHVIHLNNLFNDINIVEYRTMLQGKPQTLVSKFKISYNLVLNLIENGITNYNEYCARSMIQMDINLQIQHIRQQITDTQNTINNMKNNFQYMRTPYDVVTNYISLLDKVKQCGNNKKRKPLERDIKNIEEQYKFLQHDLNNVINYNNMNNTLLELNNEYNNSEQYLHQQMERIIQLLLNEKYISIQENNIYILSTLGNITTNIYEVPSLTFGLLIHDKDFTEYSVEQLIQLFSCFTNIVVSDDYISYHPNTLDNHFNKFLLDINNKNNEYRDFEINYNLNTGIDYTMHYDLLKYIELWCNAENENECKKVLTMLEQEKGIFLGEFVKAILKINNISSELEKVSEYLGDISLLHKLKQIPHKTLKYIATNQSLYI